MRFSCAPFRGLDSGRPALSWEGWGRGWERALCSSETLAEPPGVSLERAGSIGAGHPLALPSLPPEPGTSACPGI